jgi:hypothetical protein
VIRQNKVLIELVDANHRTLDKGFINFVIPDRAEPDSHH